MSTCWLLKAEPDSRIVKGTDVKFSIDDFEKAGTEPWNGVRNHQAKLLLKNEMKLGHKALFYQSNCKVPGVAGTAVVAREGYPDHTAFDSEHPYYDSKSTAEAPVWYMVDVTFVQRLPHLVSLKLLQTLAEHEAPPNEVSYISQEELDSVKDMVLLKRGRLSVQPVPELAYAAIVKLGEQGGFEALLPAKGGPQPPSAAAKGKGKAAKKRKAEDEDEVAGDDGAAEDEGKPREAAVAKPASKKAAVKPKKEPVAPRLPVEGRRQSGRQTKAANYAED